MLARNSTGGRKGSDFDLHHLFGLLFLIPFIVLAGCQVPADSPGNVEISWQIIPETPQVGTATIPITLIDSAGKLIEGAEINLEGNMSHPGMQPVMSRAEEIRPGRYSAPFEFTMAGDWFIIIRATLPDSTRVERQIDIPGVHSQ